MPGVVGDGGSAVPVRGLETKYLSGHPESGKRINNNHVLTTYCGGLHFNYFVTHKSLSPFFGTNIFALFIIPVIYVAPSIKHLSQIFAGRFYWYVKGIIYLVCFRDRMLKYQHLSLLIDSAIYLSSYLFYSLLTIYFYYVPIK